MFVYRAIYTISWLEYMEKRTNRHQHILRDLKMVGQPIDELMKKYNRHEDGWARNCSFSFHKKD